ncbi:MAG: chemotaxis protein CheX [Candidatus Acidiferrum sp.]
MSSLTNSSSSAGVRFDPNWKSIMECAAVEVFELMAGVRMELLAAPGEPRGEQTAMVGMAGALCGMTSVRCTRITAGKLAGLMLGGDAATDPAMARDALGELCNMIAGNFKAKVSNLADHCMLSVPTVITGDDYSMETAPPSECITLALDYEAQPIFVTLVTHS